MCHITGMDIPQPVFARAGRGPAGDNKNQNTNKYQHNQCQLAN